VTNEHNKQAARPYRKRARAEQEERTRQRITEAAVKLHGTVGPARTTIKGVAEEAGVQRATVYRHFPSDESLFAACSAHWAALNPPPDPTPWIAIADPARRLRQALGEMYAWYEAGEQMLTNVRRDGPVVPAMAGPRTAMREALEAYADVLMEGRRSRGARRDRTRAAIGHALAFETWQSLVRDRGLDRREAVGLMTAMVAGA
jgi:AcrR family transcriptional regulator